MKQEPTLPRIVAAVERETGFSIDQIKTATGDPQKAARLHGIRGTRISEAERNSCGTAGERHAAEAMKLSPTRNRCENAAPAVVHQRLVQHLDLFSGIGGFALAARMVGGIKTAAFCEIDPWARRILAKNFPSVPIHDDVKTLNPKDYGTIDLITGGYPCQPFSTAGHKRGEADPRHLWPHMRRVIQEAGPAWVLCENVDGHVRQGLDQVCQEMETDGYTVQPLLIPAAGVGARHRRNRVWILAHRESFGRGQGDANQGWSDAGVQARQEPRSWDVLDSVWGEPLEALFGGEAYGLPDRVDRLRGLGNAIVPQVAAEVLRAMMRVDHSLLNA